MVEIIEDLPHPTDVILADPGAAKAVWRLIQHLDSLDVVEVIEGGAGRSEAAA